MSNYNTPLKYYYCNINESCTISIRCQIHSYTLIVKEALQQPLIVSVDLMRKGCWKKKFHSYPNEINT